MNDVSSRAILKILSLTAVFVGGLWLMYAARHELVWVGTAFFLAIAFNPLVEWLARFMPKRNRLMAVGLVFLSFIALVVFLLVSFVPPLITQSEQLTHTLPRFTNELVTGDSWVSEQIRHYNLVDRVRESQDQLLGYAQAAGAQVFTIAQSLFSSLIAVITILGLTFFMMLEGPGWVAAFWQVFPLKRREHAKKLTGQMYRAVTGYVSGNLFTSLIAAVATSIMLMVVGVPYAIPLGIFVGLVDLLPLVGATIGAVVVILVALFTSSVAAIVMAVFFAIYQQLENHVIQPIVYGKTVEISPLLVLIAVLVGAAVGGIVGAVVAIPVFASLQILVKDYVKRRLAKTPS
jgi:predicted PurR-regulated permease PerM